MSAHSNGGVQRQLHHDEQDRQKTPSTPVLKTRLTAVNLSIPPAAEMLEIQAVVNLARRST